MDDQHTAAGDGQSNGRKILERVVTQFLDEEAVDAEIADRAQHQRVAVRRRLRGELRSDAAVCAGAVIDDHRLPDGFAQFGRNEARDGIDSAAGRLRCDQAYRFRGVIGRLRMSELSRHQ